MGKNETLFYNKLKDIFIGAKIEGNSGFINLMRIKSSYFDVIFKELNEEANEKTKDFPEFREEMFDKLYTFFQTYFSESGSIYFTYTPLKSKIYDKIYTDQEDVILFWKTRMLYYVKTDKIWHNLKVEYEKEGKKYTINFDVSKLQQKSGNEKKDLIYHLGKFSKEEITLYPEYSDRGRTTKLDEISKNLKSKKINLNEDDLDKIFKIFEKQNEVDYFINKNAKEFLKEQFDLWLKNYVFDDETDFSEKRLKELKTLKEIAYKIIDFISQFEDELVKVWNKPKFVLNSNYVITLNRIANKEKGIELIKKILNHRGIEDQIIEWKELDLIDENFNKKLIFQKTLNGETLNDNYKFLPIDTKYFKDLELDILSIFEDLDNELDGWLIHSENYQALNTILPKFKEKVQTIYIDPPFNKEQNADYLYNVKYKDSTWATTLENRISLAKYLLKDTGSIFVRCDYNGNWIVRPLMNDIFGKENFRNEVVVSRTKTALYIGTPKKLSKNLGSSYDNIYWYSKFSDISFPKISQGIIEIPRDAYWKDLKSFYDRPNYRYELLGILPEDGCSWVWKKEDVLSAIENYNQFTKNYEEKIKEVQEVSEIIKKKLWEKASSTFEENTINALIEEYWNKTGRTLRFVKRGKNTFYYWVEPIQRVSITDWTSIEGYARLWKFSTENSEALLRRVIEFTSNQSDFILDFFLGSGTTTAVAHKLHRKWIGVEMGDHFYSIVLPRMKKVLAYDSSGISKEKDVQENYNEDKAGGFFKYYDLEQYEQTLRKCHYIPSEPLSNLDNKDIYNQYVFLKDSKLLDSMELDYKRDKIKIHFDMIYLNIDVAETISLAKGEPIKSIGKDYVILKRDKTEEKINYDDLDFKTIKSFIWW